MFYRLRRSILAANLRRRVAAIFATKPPRLSAQGVSVVSMVGSPDLAAYLLAIKSFCAAIPARSVTAIIARAELPDFRSALAAHIPGIELIETESISTGSCQRGGTWERLLYILDRSEHDYVVQLDSDTLTLGPGLAEVSDCVARNQSFTLGGGPAGSGQEIVTMAEAAASLDFASDYIGIVAQRRFNEYPGAERHRYVRGSSAFAGFAKGGISRQAVEEFHAHMSRLLGARWSEWGTEQCASNFAIANSPGARVLPWPAYTNFEPEHSSTDATRFLHFLGSVRYRDGCYARLAQSVIGRLLAADAASASRFYRSVIKNGASFDQPQRQKLSENLTRLLSS